MKTKYRFTLKPPIQQTNNVTLTIVFDAPITGSPTINVPKLKFNKAKGVCLDFDDAAKSSYIAYTEKLKTTYFDDGTGTGRKFSAGVAVNGRNQFNNQVIGNDISYLQYDKRALMIADGWDIKNHSFYHNPTADDPNNEFQYGNDAVRNVTELNAMILADEHYQMNEVVVPTNFPGFMTAASNFGYLIGNSEGTFDGFPHIPPFVALGNTSSIPDNFDFLACKRTFSDVWDNTGSQWSNVSDLYSDATKNFLVIGTHGLDLPGQLDNFKAWIDQIVSLSNGNTIFCSLREFIEYQYLKQRVIRTSSIDGNTLTVTLDYSQVTNQFISWFDLSLNILNTTGNIVSVSSNNNSYGLTFNASTKLINLTKRKTNWSSVPEIPEEPGDPYKLSLDIERFFVLDKYDTYIDSMIDGVTSDITPVMGYNLKTNPCEFRYDFGKSTPNIISKIRIYDGSGSYNFKIYAVDQNFNETLLVDTNNPNYAVWNEFEISNSPRCRYLKFLTQDWNFPSEIEIFGTLPQAGAFISPPIQRMPLRSLSGFNGFEWNWLADPYHPDERNAGVYVPKISLFDFAGGFRQYMDWSKIEREETKFTFSPTFSGGWHYDDMYAAAHSTGCEMLACLQKLPPYMMNTWPSNERQDDNIPVKYPLPFNVAESFIEYGRAAFQFAARYGSNSAVDPSLIKIDTAPINDYTPIGNIVKIGLNIVKHLEFNNEPDRWWRDIDAQNGRNSYMTGREYAASLSAAYDGNKNTMGLGVGAKNADPNMKIFMAGIASDRSDYVKGIISWCEQYRGYNSDGSINLPFDVINWHYYPSDAAASQGESTKGIAPELAGFDSVVTEFNKLRNYKLDLQLAISEIGYDDDPSSNLYANPIADKTSPEVVADWTLRISLLAARYGVSYIYFFQVFDEGRDGRFNSSGFFVETVNYDTAVPPNIVSVDLHRKPSGNFQYQMVNQFGTYSFDSSINSDPHVDKYVDGTNIIYAAWIPDQINRTGTYVLTVPSGTASVTIYKFDYYSVNPITTTLSVVNNQVTLNLTETPIFVKI